MKQIIFILSFAVLIGAGLWYAKGVSLKSQEQSAAVATSVLEINEPSYDFGEISMAKGVVGKEFKIKNPSANSVEIESIYTSCMCTEATLEVGGKKFGPYGMPGHGFGPKVRQTIGAGEEVSILVEFDPAAHGPAGVGPIQRAVAVETKDGARLELEISALVKP